MSNWLFREIAEISLDCSIDYNSVCNIVPYFIQESSNKFLLNIIYFKKCLVLSTITNKSTNTKLH